MARVVKQVLPASKVDMGGAHVLQPLPTLKVEQIDPFLLLHHAITNVPKGMRPNDVGVGPHPHRGFSPVTFVFKGDMHHRDSRGNSKVVHAGGVQWMSAGMGIIHSERPSAEALKTGGEQEFIQLWINTPAAKKMDEPKYFAVEKNNMPTLANIDGDVRVVAGEINGIKGPVMGEFPLQAAMGKVNYGKVTLSKPAGFNGFIYVLSGQARLTGFGLLDAQTLYQLEQEITAITLQVGQDLQFVYVAAAPLNEKVEHYGPYVMNNQTQIMEAMRDYQMGKMGFLVEEFE